MGQPVPGRDRTACRCGLTGPDQSPHPQPATDTADHTPRNPGTSRKTVSGEKTTPAIDPKISFPGQRPLTTHPNSDGESRLRKIEVSLQSLSKPGSHTGDGQ
jgi:hypothetical protein